MAKSRLLLPRGVTAGIATLFLALAMGVPASMSHATSIARATYSRPNPRSESSRFSARSSWGTRCRISGIAWRHFLLRRL